MKKIIFSTEYLAVNKLDKWFYVLDNRNWQVLLNDKQCFQDLDYLRSEILEKCFDISFSEIYNIKDLEELNIIQIVMYKVAPSLFGLFKNTSDLNIDIVKDDRIVRDDYINEIRTTYSCYGSMWWDIKRDKNLWELNTTQ